MSTMKTGQTTTCKWCGGKYLKSGWCPKFGLKFSQTPVEAKIESVKVLRLVKTETKDYPNPDETPQERRLSQLIAKHIMSWTLNPENIEAVKRVAIEFTQPEPEESQTEFSNFLFKNLDDYKFMKEGWKEGTHQYETYDLMVREYRKIIDKFLETTIQRKKQ